MMECKVRNGTTATVMRPSGNANELSGECVDSRTSPATPRFDGKSGGG